LKKKEKKTNQPKNLISLAEINIQDINYVLVI